MLKRHIGQIAVWMIAEIKHLVTRPVHQLLKLAYGALEIRFAGLQFGDTIPQMSVAICVEYPEWPRVVREEAGFSCLHDDHIKVIFPILAD